MINKSISLGVLIGLVLIFGLGVSYADECTVQQRVTLLNAGYTKDEINKICDSSSANRGSDQRIYDVKMTFERCLHNAEIQFDQCLERRRMAGKQDYGNCLDRRTAQKRFCRKEYNISVKGAGGKVTLMDKFWEIVPGLQ